MGETQVPGGSRLPVRRVLVPELQADDIDLFEVWWSHYPKRVAKKKARQIWEKLNPSREQVERMLSTLAWQRKTPQWLKENGEFIPHPTTYLNQERFDDEPLPQDVSLLSNRAAKTLAAGQTFLEMLAKSVEAKHQGRAANERTNGRATIQAPDAQPEPGVRGR